MRSYLYNMSGRQVDNYLSYCCSTWQLTSTSLTCLVAIDVHGVFVRVGLTARDREPGRETSVVN